jgi:hypothetical protein
VLIVIVMIIVPVLLGFPAVFFSIPPLMVLIPAALPFRVQIPPPLLGVVAVFAVFLDRFIEPRFCLFDRMLTLASVIRMGLRCGYKKPECARYYECHRCLC